MAAATQRLRSAADFSAVMKRGARSGRRTVVVHVARTGDAPCMAGFAVSKAVGTAVVRNRVKRRLRAISREVLEGFDHGAAMVVRALPPAAEASFAELSRDVRSAAEAAFEKVRA